MVSVCKCHPKFTPEGAEIGASAGGEGQEYEEVDGGEGGVAISDPIPTSRLMEEEEGEEGTHSNLGKKKLMPAPYTITMHTCEVS